MFLKLHYNNYKKKMKFNNDLKSIENLRSLIRSFDKWKLRDFEMTYKDTSDGEINTLEDSHDMDYLIDLSEGQRFMEIFIENNEEHEINDNLLETTEIVDLEEGIGTNFNPLTRSIDDFTLISQEINMMRKKNPQTVNEFVEVGKSELEKMEKEKQAAMEEARRNKETILELTKRLEKAESFMEEKYGKLDETICQVNFLEEENKVLKSRIEELDLLKLKDPNDVVSPDKPKKQTPKFNLTDHSLIIPEELQRTLNIQGDMTESKTKARRNSFKNDRPPEFRPKPMKFKKNLVNRFVVMTKHNEITCDECKVGPIIGRRFNCVICPDYDLCEKCEENSVHEHPMIRHLGENNDFEWDINTNYPKLKQKESVKKMVMTAREIECLDKEKSDLLDYLLRDKKKKNAEKLKKKLLKDFKHLGMDDFYVYVKDKAKKCK